MTTVTQTQSKANRVFIEQHPALKRVFDRMPEEVAASFTEQQLTHLVAIIGTRNWGKHSVDRRGTFKLPFIKRRFYYVILLGKNYRELSRREKQVSLLATASLIMLVTLFCGLMGLLMLYLLKSALGINLFENFSLGIWDWFKALWK